MTEKIISAIEQLAAPNELKALFHEQQCGHPLPSQEALQQIIETLRSIIFPGFYGRSSVNMDTIGYHIGVHVERLHKLLGEQILAGLCFVDEAPQQLDTLKEKAEQLASDMVERLPQLRATLATDVEAAYLGDPAATTQSEIIACYPCIKALTNYRLAHELFVMQVPLIPRMLTEMAHSETGIDIHPGASIGHHFCIDHGTGVVIGGTCIIGNNVKLYQGVTLGAKSFPLDEEGNPIKGIPRHPILEDDVIIYSNATVLGRVTISKGTVVGANKWVTTDL
ncbi:MAG: serine acetyltransferase [Bacteroidaceae bacterium]|nr:serine acetyltransferase [Bacteroidaceae bacterium]